MLRRIFSAIASKAAASLPPWYSTAAQMTPPALAMKSGTDSTPRSCRARSASGVAGMFAPCSTSRAWIDATLPSWMQSGRAAGIRTSQGKPKRSAASICLASL